MGVKNMPYFDEVEQSIDFPQMEKELLDHWYKNGIVDKYLNRNKASKKYFSFIDGPITANNPMGVHHGWGRTYKDLWQRFKNMQGFRQRFQNGFDSQGLWVEVEVEKELGFHNKRDIETYGVAKFVQKCKDRVKKFSDIQTQQSKRLGYFMDWDNSYFTMSDHNNYMIWHFLKVCHENGWIYKGKESVPWCPRCQTAISQHEMLTEDYKDVVHKSIYFKLPIIGRDREFLLVWTTTPWTLPANIAVAVDAKLDYALVKGNTGDKYWVAKEVVDRVFGKGQKVVKTCKGSSLVGVKYKGPFDDLPAVAEVAKESDKFHIVVATDDRIMPVNTNEGTGLIHTAVSAGTEDYKLGKKLGLPMIPVIADDASYFDGFGFLSGKNAKKHPELILDYLEEEDKKDGIDWVFKIENYKHRYPGCWRCKTELVWKVADEWYIAMDQKSKKGTRKQGYKDTNNKDTLRRRMVKVTKNIDWIPEFGLKRELDWLNNMHDWLISKKNRYWGLALPIWECDQCGEFDVIGSKKELKKRAVSGWKQFEDKSPHKPYIDKLKLNCKCGGEMNRIEPVGTPWLDAGIVAYSTVSSDNSGKLLYETDKKEWAKWVPADFITESFPGQFKNWFYAMIAMSTVLTDMEPYKKVLGFATLLDEKGKAMHKSWGNAIEFNEGADKIGVDVMRWMYLKQGYSDNLLFGYSVADQTRRQFHLKLWNVYNYFVTYSNLHGWKPKRDYRSQILDLRMNVLDRWILLRLNETVNTVTEYLEDFVAYKATEAIEDFVNDLSNWYIRRSRDRASVVSDEVDRDSFFATTHYLLLTLSTILAPFTPYISDDIYTNLTKGKSVHLADWPTASNKSTKNGLQLLADMRLAREIVEMGHSQRKDKEIPVRQPLGRMEVVSGEKKPVGSISRLIEDELNIKNLSWKKGSVLSVELDTIITSELKQERKARELIRQIQVERRKMGISFDQKVIVKTTWIPENEKLVQLIKGKTLTKTISAGKFSVSIC